MNVLITCAGKSERFKQKFWYEIGGGVLLGDDDITAKVWVHVLRMLSGY